MTDAKKKKLHNFTIFENVVTREKKNPAYTEFLMRKCVKVIIHSISMTKLKNYITAYVYIYCALKCITLNCKKKKWLQRELGVNKNKIYIKKQ